MRTETRKTTKGNTVHLLVFDKEAESALSSDENLGLCIRCGAEAYGVEPDARRYPCEDCGQNGVYGLEELLLMGYIAYPKEEVSQ
jgi:hypothetical protein